MTLPIPEAAASAPEPLALAAGATSSARGDYGLRRGDPGGDPSALAFQIIAVVVQDRRPVAMYYTPAAAVGPSFMETLPHGDPAGDEACTVCIFATEQSGATAVIKVLGFRPHLTYEVPPGSRARFTRSIEEALACRVTCEPLMRTRLYGWVPADPSPTGAGALDPSTPRSFACLRVSSPWCARFARRCDWAPCSGQCHGSPRWTR